MPVSTSPVPPEAIPGLPVGFRNTVPSGAATTLTAPLSTRNTRWAVANARATAMRSRCTSGTLDPTRRAISPGCGVRQRGAGRLAQELAVARERGQRIGVDHHRHRHLEHETADDVLDLGVEPEARAERDGVAAAHELDERRPRALPEASRRAFLQRRRHGLEHEAGHDRLLARGRRDGDEPDPAPQRALGGERGRPGLPERARDHQQMAIGALVRRALATREVPRDVRRLELEGRDPARDLRGRHPDVHDADASGELAPGRERRARASARRTSPSSRPARRRPAARCRPPAIRRERRARARDAPRR